MKELLSRLIKNRVAKNAGWLIGGKVAQMIISLIVSILTARYLGPSNYGLVNYGAAYTAFFLSLCTLGINSVIVKEFVDNRSAEGTIIGTTLFLRLISSILSSVIITIIVSFVDSGEKDTIIIVSLCSIGLIFGVFDTFNYWFQAQLLSKVSAIATLVAYIITSAYRIILLLKGASVYYFALAKSIDYVCVAIILIIAYRKYNGKKLKLSFKYGVELLKKSAPFIVPGIMVAIYSQTDKMMLKQMYNQAEVGYYSTAVSLCNVWCFVLMAIIDSMYPVIMEAFKKNKDIYKQRNRLLYAIVFYVSIFVSTIISIIAPWIVELLYGSEYAATAVSLRIITWYTAFSYLGVARNAWIVCEKKQKYLIHLYVSSALVNVALNLILIPKYGAAGAAIASLAAQILTTMVIPLFIKPLKENTILMLEGIALRRLK